MQCFTLDIYLGVQVVAQKAYDTTNSERSRRLPFFSSRHEGLFQFSAGLKPCMFCYPGIQVDIPRNSRIKSFSVSHIVLKSIDTHISSNLKILDVWISSAPSSNVALNAGVLASSSSSTDFAI